MPLSKEHNIQQLDFDGEPTSIFHITTYQITVSFHSHSKALEI